MQLEAAPHHLHAVSNHFPCHNRVVNFREPAGSRTRTLYLVSADAAFKPRATVERLNEKSIMCFWGEQLILTKPKTRSRGEKMTTVGSVCLSERRLTVNICLFLLNSNVFIKWSSLASSHQRQRSPLKHDPWAFLSNLAAASRFMYSSGWRGQSSSAV